MKNRFIYYICLAAMATLGLSSCEDNETPVYDVSRTALNIWCGTETIPVDSLTYNYSYSMDEDSIMFFARVSGMPADHDRMFTLEVVEGTIEEAEGSYRVKTYTIPAGETEVECPIYFDTSLLKDDNLFTKNYGDGFLKFKLAPNNEFSEGVEEMSSLNIVLRNYLAKPDNWDSADNPYLPLSRFFGEYSDEKYQFMIDALDLIDFKVNANASVTYDEETNEVSYNYANYLLEQVRIALEEYNATHEEPLKDASGAEINF